MTVANLLTQRTAALARLQVKANGFFSIENPLGSIIWWTPAMKRVAAMPGVKPSDGDQCIGGGPYRKPTRWLTNAPWLKVLERWCPGEPDHPEHITLEGYMEMEDGSRCFKTARQAKAVS